MSETNTRFNWKKKVFTVRKSAPHWNIYRKDVISEFLNHFKPFSIPKFAMTKCFCQSFPVIAFFFQTALWYFYHENVLLQCSSNIKWDVMISSFLRLLLKIGTWHSCQNRIEKYHYDGEQLGFYKKVDIKTQRLSKKKDVFVIFALQETRNFNLFKKNRTQDNLKCHI